MPIRILVVDNQSMVRRGLIMFLGTDSEVEIVGEAGNGREAVETALDLQPDMVLMDLLMPEMDGIAATRAIREQQPDVHIVALSSSTDYTLISASILAGVSTYLHKGSKPHLLLSNIKGVIAGKVILSPVLAERVLNALPAPVNVEALSPDEVVPLRLLATGHGDDDIASQLQMDTAAVQLAVQQIQTKLSSSSRLLAVLRAMQLGLIERFPPS